MAGCRPRRRPSATRIGLLRRHLRLLDHLGHHLVARSCQLVERAQERHTLALQAEPVEEAVENHAVVDADGEGVEAKGAHEVVDDEHGFDVGGIGSRADGVEIALPELTPAAVPGVFTAPDRAHVIAFERRAEFADMLRRKTREGHRQVEAQRDIPVAMVLEAVKELVRFRAALAEQDLRVFEPRACRWGEAVGTIDARACSIMRSRTICSAGRKSRNPLRCGSMSLLISPWSVVRSP